ncbi:hypothetical protein TWF730_006849 [Orbilia blumenaviensis]|uniref:DNA/pantothenate metabolism flavoprotein C-terminal domain-containing protein n=1 Tax=Orbilia blumenaviensis TaxID=1796055 RepID=A0AAV9VGX7_9PEZI
MSASGSSINTAHVTQSSPAIENAIDRSAPNFTAAAEKDETTYFDTNPKPAELEEFSRIAEEFVNLHCSHQRRVVLVTSGGTTVPLENQTVRFIDNFSAGTRGATSAEYFLEAGYAVIFLHRQFSLLPYSRHYSHSTNCFLDFLAEAPTDGSRHTIVAREEYTAKMISVLRKYKHAKREKLLLLLPFTTITSYLFLLRELAMKMRPLGGKALFYLAAAVSDFFVPRERMAEHKIQSGEFAEKDGEMEFINPAGPGSGKKLIIDLDPVPKFLKRLVESWAPEGMIVSFKLETDPKLLIKKCTMALKRYSHHLVIGNLLQHRKYEVVFVDQESTSWLRLPQNAEEETNGGKLPGKQNLEIEALIVPEVVRRHGAMIWHVVAATRSSIGGLPD